MQYPHMEDDRRMEIPRDRSGDAPETSGDRSERRAEERRELHGRILQSPRRGHPSEDHAEENGQCVLRRLAERAETDDGQEPADRRTVQVAAAAGVDALADRLDLPVVRVEYGPGLARRDGTAWDMAVCVFGPAVDA